MRKTLLAKIKNKRIPIIIEKDDKFYVVECPIFRGCYSQGRTIDEALRNIREAVELCLEERENQEILESYDPVEFSIHNINF